MGGTQTKKVDSDGGDMDASEADSHDTRVSFSLVEWFASGSDEKSHSWVPAFLLASAFLVVGVCGWKRRRLAQFCADVADHKNTVRKNSRAEAKGNEDIGMVKFKGPLAASVVSPVAVPPTYYPSSVLQHQYFIRQVSQEQVMHRRHMHLQHLYRPLHLLCLLLFSLSNQFLLPLPILHLLLSCSP